MKSSSLMFVVIFLAFSSLKAADPPKADKPELVRMTLKGGRAVVGQILSQDDDELRLLDVKTGEQPVFKRNAIQIAPKKLADDEAIRAVGFPNFLAWRLKQTLGEPKAGKIAEITPSVIYVSLGAKNGIERGQKLVVLRDDGVVRDPDTGDILTRRIAKIANLEVTDVEESFLKAKLLGNLEVQLLVGDIVRIDRPEKMIAVLPLIDTAGETTEGGQAFCEELTTGLVKNGITVVERSQLEKIVRELNLQQGKIFDPEVAQNLGRQLGAFAVVAGSIVPKDKFAEAHVRVIKVDSGEILLAQSQRLVSGEKAPAKSVSKTGRSNNKNGVVKLAPKMDDEKSIKEVFTPDGNWRIEQGGLHLFTGASIISVREFVGDFSLNLTGRMTVDNGRHYRITVFACGESHSSTVSGNTIIRVDRKGDKIAFRFGNENPGQFVIKEANKDKPFRIRVHCVPNGNFAGKSEIGIGAITITGKIADDD